MSCHPQLTRRPCALALLVAVCCAAGCAEDGSVYPEANRAVAAAYAVLAARGVCPSVADCQRQDLVLFEAGRGVAWVNVHAALDSAVVREIADSCRRIARTDARRAPIQLSIEGTPDRPDRVSGWRERFEPQ